MQSGVLRGVESVCAVAGAMSAQEGEALAIGEVLIASRDKCGLRGGTS